MDEFLFGIGSNVLNYSDYDPESLKKQLAQDSAKIHTSEKKDLWNYFCLLITNGFHTRFRNKTLAGTGKSRKFIVWYSHGLHCCGSQGLLFFICPCEFHQKSNHLRNERVQKFSKICNHLILPSFSYYLISLTPRPLFFHSLVSFCRSSPEIVCGSALLFQSSSGQVHLQCKD